ncbi:VanZ family protein [Okibacterium fritillariae]|uniref:VanZ family protein n=1 Tax=Okibacterium fritillariae TaxID=123320 RepID=UPI0040556D6F
MTDIRLRQISSWLLAVVTVAVLVIVFWPTPVDAGARGTIARVLDTLYGVGLPRFVTYGVVEFSANIVMFLPLGLLVALALPRWLLWFSPLLCASLSLGIELCQALLLPHRFASILDVAANTLGAILGTLIAIVIVKRVRRRDRERQRASDLVHMQAARESILRGR